MVRGNVHKVTEVFWPKKYCALKVLSEMLFVQGGLEIPVTVCIELDSTSKNMLVLERYKKLVSENYKEPINGNFDDCTKDILRDLYESSDSDEDDTSSVD